MKNKLLMQLLLVGAAILFAGCPGSRNVVGPPATESWKLQLSSFNGLDLAWSPGKEELVTFSIVFKGGVSNYPAKLQGIERIALETVLAGKPSGMSDETFEKQFRATGMRMGLETEMDYSAIRMTCLRQSWREGLSLLAQWIMQPDFTFEDFSGVKATGLLKCRAAGQDPEEILTRRVRSELFSGKSYAKVPGGTLEEVKNLEYEQVREYYFDFLLQKCRMGLAWSGAPLPEYIIDEILYSLDGLPAGNCLPFSEVIPQTINMSQVSQELDLPEIWISGSFAGASIGTREGGALRVIARLLEQKLALEISNENPFASSLEVEYISGRVGYLEIRSRTRFPNRCGGTLTELLKTLRETGFEEAEFLKFRDRLYLEAMLNAESGLERTTLGARTLSCPNPDGFLEYPGILRSLSLEDCNAVFRKYCRGLSWVLLGNTEQADPLFFEIPIETLPPKE